MARIRSIRPEFWSDEKVVRLSLAARLVFLGLSNFADDDGRGRAYPRELAGFIFPVDESIAIAPLLREIEATGMVHFGAIDGLPLFHIPKFRKHQKPEKPTPSRFPDPSTWCVECRRLASSASLPEASPNSRGEVVELLPEGSGSSGGVGHGTLEVGTRKEHAPSSEGGASIRDLSSSRGDAYPEDFEAFWAAYPGPRKKKKLAALKAYQAARKRGVTPERIMAGLDRSRRSKDWQNEGGKFIEGPEVWLNAGAYDGDPEAAPGLEPLPFADKPWGAAIARHIPKGPSQAGALNFANACGVDVDEAMRVYARQGFEGTVDWAWSSRTKEVAS